MVFILVKNKVALDGAVPESVFCDGIRSDVDNNIIERSGCTVSIQNS